MMDQQEEDDVDVCGGGEETLPALPPSSSSYSLAEIQNVPVIEQSKKGNGAKNLLSKKRPLKIDSDDTASDDGLDAQSRKQKSLGLLCQRFLTAMGDASRKGNEIHLESVARKMAVEKRRIYDIVNVMEALEAMSKTNKSFYQWNGLRYLPQLMAQLQKDALAEGLPNRVAAVELAMCNFTELAKSRGRTLATEIVGTMVTDKNDDNDSGYFAGGAGGYSPDDDKENNFHAKSRQVQEEKVNNNNNRSSSSVRFSRDRNGRNSLAQLCRRFLMVLLCNPNNKRQVSLDVASTVLIKDPDSENIEPPSRSRCRRLYDIANVLVAMGLIKKVHYLFGTKKIPLFVYSGPEPDQNGKLEPYDPETFVEQTHTAEEDNYVAKKKLALAAARSAPRDDIKPKSSITRFEQRSASLMDICEIAERERMRLIAGDDAENENVISMAVVQPEKSKPTVKPKAKFIRQSSATTTTSNHRKYVVRIGDTYHISPNPASITTVGLNSSSNSPTISPTTGTIRRSVSSTTTSPYHQHRYLLNTSPYPPSGMFIPPSISSTITSTSSSPFRQINHPTVAHSVNSILSNHNHRQGPVQYRIVPPPMLPAFRTGTMSLCKDGLYRDILLPESAD